MISSMSCFPRTRKHQEEIDKSTLLRNGEILLRELITSFNGKRNPIRAFSAKDLKTATSNYDTGNVITRDCYYRLYKGFLKDGPISVMKFEDDTSIAEAKESFNCIVFASQMCHKNILKLIGCCLETETPILVFESAESVTVINRILRPLELHFEPLLLIHRLKIAMEIANAIAYLHAGFPRPIVYRKISLSNIVFNDQYVAKLFDFSLSVSIPEGETHIKDEVLRGTLEYMAPEYLRTGGDFNEKFDVHSFGVLLFELLARKRISDMYRDWEPDEPTFEKYMEEGFNKIVDPIILGEEPYSGKDLQLQTLKQLVLKCVSESAGERPTMIDVAKQLRQMYRLSLLS